MAESLCACCGGRREAEERGWLVADELLELEKQQQVHLEEDEGWAEEGATHPGFALHEGRQAEL